MIRIKALGKIHPYTPQDQQEPLANPPESAVHPIDQPI
jgi:hypothetical protein